MSVLFRFAVWDERDSWFRGSCRFLIGFYEVARETESKSVSKTSPECNSTEHRPSLTRKPEMTKDQSATGTNVVSAGSRQIASTGRRSELSFNMSWRYQICTAWCFYSVRENLPKYLFKVTAQECQNSTSG